MLSVDRYMVVPQQHAAILVRNATLINLYLAAQSKASDVLQHQNSTNQDVYHLVHVAFPQTVLQLNAAVLAQHATQLKEQVVIKDLDAQLHLLKSKISASNKTSVAQQWEQV